MEADDDSFDHVMLPEQLVRGRAVCSCPAVTAGNGAIC